MADKRTKNREVMRLINHFEGSQTKTAEALNVTKQAVSLWLYKKRTVAPLDAIRAAVLTDGKVCAFKLCPDLNSDDIDRWFRMRGMK